MHGGKEATYKHYPHTLGKCPEPKHCRLNVPKEQFSLFFHHLILVTLTDTACLVLPGGQKSQHPCTEQLQGECSWADPCQALLELLLWGHGTAGICSQLPSVLWQGAIWDAVSSPWLIFAHAGIPKPCFSFQNKNTARKPHFTESRISARKENNKHLVT